MRSAQIGMSHPVFDYADVVTGLKQVHCCRVTDRVCTDFLGFNGGTRFAGFIRILTDDVSQTETGDWPSIGVEKQRWTLRYGRLPSFDVISESLNGFRPQRAGPFFSSLSQKLYLIRFFESQLVNF